ncbi:MAG: T9SS type A sorting domain-containing protein [bacterium]|nr:T9SS type A sorting domain-containing protein [bacterium]
MTIALGLASILATQAAMGGMIIACGGNSDGQAVNPVDQYNFVAVEAGVLHSLGVKSNGSIVAWGANTHGQCNVPPPNTGFIAVAGGYAHSLGLKADGSIVAWGTNSHGQCDVPPPNTGFVAVSAGYLHSLALKSDGSIVAWGYNAFGQTTVPGVNSGFTALDAGAYHSLGLKADGSIVAWGKGDSGQCTVPAPNSGFVSISGGLVHSLGVRANGSVDAWGDNSWGQCNVPPPNAGFARVSGGDTHSRGLKIDGSVIGWGDLYGHIYPPPCHPGHPTVHTAIAVGRYHNLALTEDGNLAEQVVAPASLVCDNGQLDPASFTVEVSLSNSGCEPCEQVIINLMTWQNLTGGGPPIFLGTVNPGDTVSASFVLEPFDGPCDLYGQYGIEILSANCADTGHGYEIWIPCCEQEPVDVDEQPMSFGLDTARPNPFNPATTISFTMAETGPATLTVYNLAGAPVATLWQGMAQRGSHQVVFDASHLPSGVYFYALGTPHGVLTRKMVLAK